MAIYSESVFDYIRNNWKQKGLKELAKDLKTSRPTIKRWAETLGINLRNGKSIQKEQRRLQRVQFCFADILLKEFKIFKRRVKILLELEGIMADIPNALYRDCFLKNMTAEETVDFFNK